MGTHPFSHLPIVMEAYANSLPKAVAQAVRFVIQPGFNEMVNSTPVDTARAVSNWRMSRGGPDKRYHESLVPNSAGGSGGSTAKQRVIQMAQKVIAFFSPGEQALYITNNAPYIGVLNYGDSKHSGRHMVQRGMSRMQVAAKGVRILKMTEGMK